MLPVIFDSEKMNQLVNVCKHFSGSSLVPHSLRGKPQDIAIIMIMAHELNVPPMQSLTQISVIQGKPCVSPQMMIGLVKSKLAGAVIKIKQDVDEHGEPTASCIVARSIDDLNSGLEFEAKWDMNKARAMGLANKDNYKKQAPTMLKWRAVGEACRTMFADVILGIYLPEEFQDFEGNEVKETLNQEEELEKDFVIPLEEKEIGFKYRIQNGKYRNRQIKDLTLEEIETERDRIAKVLKSGKAVSKWHDPLHAVLSDIIENYEDHEAYFYETEQ